MLGDATNSAAPDVAAANATTLDRPRDGAYAADLVRAAVCDDAFAWLARHGPVPAAALCEAMAWAARPTDVLLTLCAAHGLVERFVEADDLVTVSELARRHLAGGTSTALRPGGDPAAGRPAVAEFATVLRTDRPASGARAAACGTTGADAREALLARGVARTLDDLRVRRVLRVGDGAGTDVTAGLCDPWPRGWETHLLVDVLHHVDAGRVEQLLARSHDALAPGGRLVDVDAHVDGRRTGPLPVAEYSAALVHATPGKCWSVNELAGIAARVGFAGVEVRRCVGDHSALVFTRAS